MSTIAERAALEAEAAEAEFPDEESEEEQAAEEETETEETEIEAPAMSERDRERIIGKLDNESDRHTKRVAEILGSDVTDLAPCPACWEHAPGFVLAGVELDEVQAAMVRGLLNISDAPTLNTNEEYVRCETCDGWGEIDSQSRRDDQKSQPCPVCTLKGWVRVAKVWTPPPAPGYTPPLAEVPAWTPPVDAIRDAYGRPAGHPHFGMDPAKVGMVS